MRPTGPLLALFALVLAITPSRDAHAQPVGACVPRTERRLTGSAMLTLLRRARTDEARLGLLSAWGRQGWHVPDATALRFASTFRTPSARGLASQELCVLALQDSHRLRGQLTRLLPPSERAAFLATDVAQRECGVPLPPTPTPDPEPQERNPDGSFACQTVDDCEMRSGCCRPAAYHRREPHERPTPCGCAMDLDSPFLHAACVEHHCVTVGGRHELGLEGGPPSAPSNTGRCAVAQTRFVAANDGEPDASTYRLALQRRLSAYSLCYRRAQANDPALAGDVRITATVEPNGRVSAVSGEGMPSSPQAAQCMAALTRGVMFPTSAENVSVHAEIVLHCQAE